MVVDSWEDLSDDDVEAAPAATSAAARSHWQPDEADAIAAAEVSPGWKVAYTHHPGRVEAATLPVLRSVSELTVGPAGVPAKAACLSTFLPFDPSFLRHFPKGIPLTVCVQAECKKAVKRFFGVEVRDGVDGAGVRSGWSTLCARCMPRDIPERCAPDQYVKPCACPPHEFNEVQWVFPELEGRDIMHSKLMLLRFPGCVRIVVSSFNLSLRQWADAGDSFWWADLPLRLEESFHEEPRVQQPLLDTLRRWGLDRSWVQLSRFCDWSALQQEKVQVQMVTSIPNSPGDVHYGMERLRAILKSLPRFPPSAACPVTLQVWSLGGATDAWYADFARALTQERYSDVGALVDWKADHVQFIFQENGGGVNWREERERDVREDNFRRFVMGAPERRHPSTQVRRALWDEKESLLLAPRAEAPPVSWGWHSKVMTREYPVGFCKKAGCRRAHGWRYIGGHNCSRASWGWSYFDASAGAPAVEPPRNWEMGVVITSLPARSADEDCGADLATQAPLPFRRGGIRRTFPHGA